MALEGHVENGVVVFDRPVSLPDGTPVRVEVVTNITPKRQDARDGGANGSGHDPATEKTLLHEIDALKELKSGWDSYSAPAPSAAAIDNAKSMVIEAQTIGISPERVEPSGMGGVGVTFSANAREAVIEFYNNGTAHALFSDDTSEEMSTRPVSTNSDGYRQIIREVRKHLHAE